MNVEPEKQKKKESVKTTGVLPGWVCAKLNPACQFFMIMAKNLLGETNLSLHDKNSTKMENDMEKENNLSSSIPAGPEHCNAHLLP
jgi:hypothetical protein